MKAPQIGDRVSHVVIVESSIVEVVEINHFTNTAKVRDDNGRLLIIGQRKRGTSLYQVLEEISDRPVVQ